MIQPFQLLINLYVSSVRKTGHSFMFHPHLFMVIWDGLSDTKTSTYIVDAGLPLTRQGTAVSHATTEAPSEI